MLNEATWLIIIGLALDIVGAFLIIGPLRAKQKILKQVGEIVNDITERSKKPLDDRFDVTPESNREEIDKIWIKLNDKLLDEMKEYGKLKLGIALLVIGFILQIIGNWIQNPPII